MIRPIIDAHPDRAILRELGLSLLTRTDGRRDPRAFLREETRPAPCRFGDLYDAYMAWCHGHPVGRPTFTRYLDTEADGSHVVWCRVAPILPPAAEDVPRWARECCGKGSSATWLDLWASYKRWGGVGTSAAFTSALRALGARATVLRGMRGVVGLFPRW